MGRKKTAITLTAQEMGYLKELFAAGDRGRMISAQVPRNELYRLVDAGYVSLGATLCRITDNGRRVLAEAQQ